ncbi:MAG: carboxypeptidase-like regulatory domain-containing protein [Flavobacterium sp.]
MAKLKKTAFIFIIALISAVSNRASAQYVQPERNDTIYLMPKSPFDSTTAKKALAKGKGTIKGVAFIRPNNNIGFNIKTGKKVLANKIKVTLFPMTPYFQEFLSLKKKENRKKLKFAFLSNEAVKYRLEAITNSSGEFSFPEMKPGRYYLEAILNWTESGTYQKYTGSGYNNYGGRADYYANQNYTNSNSDLITKIVEIKADGEVINVKLN